MPQPKSGGKRRNRLFVDSVQTVGLVDKGDDPQARVVFMKAGDAAEGKRAETFAEAGNNEALRNELWRLEYAIGNAIRSALFEADEDQDPQQLIEVSLDQFVAEVRAALPSWLEGKPYKKAKGPKEGEAMEEEKEGALLKSIVKAVTQAIGGGGRDGDGAGVNAGKEAGEEDMTEKTFKVDELPDEAQAEFKKMQDRIAELEGGDGDGDGGSEEAAAEDMVVPEAVQKRLEKAETEAAEARKETAELLAKQRRTEVVEKLSGLNRLPGMVPAEMAPMFEKIEGALDDEEQGAFYKFLSGANAAMGTVLKVVGHSGGPESATVEAEVAGHVEELRKAEPTLSEEQARARVWKQHPGLFARYEKARKEGVPSSATAEEAQ